MKRTVTVGLVQIGEDFGGQHYLPYSVGLLQAFAGRHLPDYHEFSFLVPIYRREPLEQLTGRLSGADIVFFSAYVWNHRFSLELARRVRETNPACLVVMGGPQVPQWESALENLLRAHPFLDLACYGEGEIPFLKVLENFRENNRKAIPSAGFIDSDGSFCMTSPMERIADLNSIPSPYLEGVFDPLMAAYPGERWLALLETNRGCPFSCSYCTWGSRGKRRVYSYSLERVMAEIDWIGSREIEFVFCCDANFGIFPARDLQIVRKVAENKERLGYPRAFSVQSTKNATQTIFQLNRILEDAGLQKGVNLALQSVNPATLDAIRRNNISGRTYHDLQDLFARAGISTFSDMILALPGETYDTFADGVASVIDSGQHNRIQFINLSVLENSEMSRPEYLERYGLVTQECRAVSHHTSIDRTPEVEEFLRLVVATNDMPPHDWVKTRVFCWLTSLLYFNKLFQIPFLILHRIGAVGYRRMVGAFIEPGDSFPILSLIAALLKGKALAIQQGDTEYIASPEWLNIWWPADEYVFIKLCREGLLDGFYREGAEALSRVLADDGIALPSGLLHEAVLLNATLIKHPGRRSGGAIGLRHNIYQVYRAALAGMDEPLQEGDFSCSILPAASWASWDEWCRDAVWYGTKRGAYLDECTATRKCAATAEESHG